MVAAGRWSAGAGDVYFARLARPAGALATGVDGRSVAGARGSGQQIVAQGERFYRVRQGGIEREAARVSETGAARVSRGGATRADRAEHNSVLSSHPAAGVRFRYRARGEPQHAAATARVPPA